MNLNTATKTQLAANVTLAPATKAQIAAHLQKWAEERLPMAKSQKMLEEIFLSGYQRAAGLPRDAGNFVVSAEMLFSSRKKKVGRMLGWFLTKKDGTHETLLFKDAKDWLRRPTVILFPVVKPKQRRKPARKPQPQVAQSVAE